MTFVRDNQTGEVKNVSYDEAVSRFMAGEVGLRPDERIAMRRGEEVLDFNPADVQRAARNSFVPLTQQGYRAADYEAKAKEHGVESGIAAFSGAMEGVWMTPVMKWGLEQGGLHENIVNEEMTRIEDQNKGYYLGGLVGGSIAPALLSGGFGAASTAAKAGTLAPAMFRAASAASTASKFTRTAKGLSIASKILGAEEGAATLAGSLIKGSTKASTLARSIVRGVAGGTVGGLQAGIGKEIHDASLNVDPNRTWEQVLSNIGHSTVQGAAWGGGVNMAGRAPVMAGQKLLSLTGDVGSAAKAYAIKKAMGFTVDLEPAQQKLLDELLSVGNISKEERLSQVVSYMSGKSRASLDPFLAAPNRVENRLAVKTLEQDIGKGIEDMESALTKVHEGLGDSLEALQGTGKIRNVAGLIPRGEQELASQFSTVQKHFQNGYALLDNARESLKAVAPSLAKEMASDSELLLQRFDQWIQKSSKMPELGFKLLDDTKRITDKYVKRMTRMVEGGVRADIMNIIGTTKIPDAGGVVIGLANHADQMRAALYDPSIFGDAARALKQLNDPLNEMLVDISNVSKTNLTRRIEVKGQIHKKTVGDTEGVSRFIANVDNAARGTDSRLIRKMIDSVRTYAKTAAEIAEATPADAAAMAKFFDATEELGKVSEHAERLSLLNTAYQSLKGSQGNMTILGASAGMAMAGPVGAFFGGKLGQTADDPQRFIQALAKVDQIEKLWGDSIQSLAKSVFDLGKGKAKAAVNRVVTPVIEDGIPIVRRAAVMSDRETPKETMDRIKGGLDEAARDPHYTEKLVQLAASQGVPQEGIDVIVSRMSTFQQIMAGVMPTEGGSPFAPKKVKHIPEFKIARFQELVRAIEDPATLLVDLQNGRVDLEKVSLVEKTSPALLAQMRTAVLNEMNSRDNVPYEKRVQVSLFLGQPIDPTLSPSFVGSLQATMPKDEAKQPGGKSPPTTNGGVTKSLVKEFKTDMQRPEV